MRVVEVTPAAVEPVTLAEAKTHLRVSQSADDTYITTLITVARRQIELLTQCALINTVFNAYLDGFPCGRVLELRKGRLQSVASVQYYAYGETTLTTLAASEYRVDTVSMHGRIILLDGKYWPTVWNDGDAVKIAFTAGFGAAAANVPPQLRHAMLFLIAHFYAVRQPVITGTIVNEMPLAIESLVMPFRVAS